MAITRLHPTAEAESPLEAYPYGWRYVPFRAADGRIDDHQIPLTVEDVLAAISLTTSEAGRPYRRWPGRHAGRLGV